MLLLALLLFFLAIAFLFLSVSPMWKEERPKLQLKDLGIEGSFSIQKEEKQRSSLYVLWNSLSVVNKALITPVMRQKITHQLDIAQKDITPEMFFFLKEAFVVVFMILIPPLMEGSFAMACFLSIGLGYFLPEIWVKMEVNKVKDSLLKQLPDTVDLLGLCVNAGLDFMMALKWVIEKSPASPLVEELRRMMQEISIGKPRREALRALAKKYDMPDLATFTRTLIQADKMGTSIGEALNILSEDMRLARYRRGEGMAMKAPIKLLAPLLLCIFPVVGILVAGPIFLDFILNNPMKNMM